LQKVTFSIVFCANPTTIDLKWLDHGQMIGHCIKEIDMSKQGSVNILLHWDGFKGEKDKRERLGWETGAAKLGGGT
jgi:hypothetical protein